MPNNKPDRLREQSPEFHIVHQQSGLAQQLYMMQPKKMVEMLVAQIEADGLSVQGMSVLDFACGRGELLKVLKETGFDTRGIDLDPKCVDLSSQYAEAVQGGLDDLVELVGEKSVDILVASHILEHLPDPIAALKIFSSIARKYVVIAVPNLASWINFRNHLIGQFRSQPEGHITGWDWPTFRMLLNVHADMPIIRDYGHQLIFTPLYRLAGATGITLVDKIIIAIDRLLRPLHFDILPRIFPYITHQIMVVSRPSNNQIKD